jgi:Uma2 family endonuclease
MKSLSFSSVDAGGMLGSSAVSACYGGRMAIATPERVRVHYEVPTSREDWTLCEEPVPESQPHDLTIDLLKALLLAWVARTRLSAQVVRNLAVRWDVSRPRMGVDPDLALISPRTPEGDELVSLCTWQEGHHPPVLGIEVVSANHPHKDYDAAPEKYAACGAQELWVFDPKLAGPSSKGGPFRLQVWRRDGDGDFTRVHAGEGPAYSAAVKGWLVVVADGERVRIADDSEGTHLWETAEEAERAAKEAALARVAELELLLARRR